MTPEYTWVGDADALDQCLQACLKADRIALDTEFIRTHTYFARLGLLQLATATQCWLVDPISVPDCLQRLRPLLIAPRILKVLHAGDEDLEILAQVLGEPLYPVLDTQLAWALLGHQETIGYAGLVSAQLGHDLPKAFTRSNWLARPLSDGQCHYAALDVIYLQELLPTLEAELVRRDRLAWVLEDMARIARRVLERRPEAYYRQLRNGWSLRGNRLWLLQQLAAQRERLCAQRNQLRKHVVADADLVTIAERRPRDASGLASLTGMRPGAIRREQGWILGLIRDSHTVPASAYPPPIVPPLAKPDQPLFREIRDGVRRQAEALGVPATVLARKRDLEHYVAALSDNQVPQWPSSWVGWREPMIRPVLDEIRTTDAGVQS